MQSSYQPSKSCVGLILGQMPYIPRFNQPYGVLYYVKINYISDDTVWTEKTDVRGCLVQDQREMACSHRSRNEGRKDKKCSSKIDSTSGFLSLLISRVLGIKTVETED